MKNPDRVAELIAELRELADNDFERHRIGVLERDLSAPPTVEQIDNSHQRFNGAVYRRNKRGYYAGEIQIHRVVWTYYHGEIPDGYQIHHIDENPENNDVANLRCLTQSEHSKIHGGKSLQRKGKPLRYMDKKCKSCEKMFIGKINQEYCSSECRYAHWRASQYEDAVCEVCGKTYRRFKYNRGNVCSGKCAVTKARSVYTKLHSKTDDECLFFAHDELFR